MFKNIEDSLQETMLPNSDDITYFGSDLFSIFSKSTIKKVQNTFFGNEVQKYNYFQKSENKNGGNKTIFKN